MSYMDHDKGKALLLAITDVLDRLKVPYFLMQGTALGAYRDGGFTPTERDIDLGILQEHLGDVTALAIETHLHQLGCDTECLLAPFSRPRMIVAWSDGAKADLVSWTRWRDRRFIATPIRPWITEHYCIVHEAALLENYEEVELFGRRFRVPSPVETYLEREYGPTWHIPADDHISRTRVYDFLKTEGVPLDLLERA